MSISRVLLAAGLLVCRHALRLCIPEVGTVRSHDPARERRRRYTRRGPLGNTGSGRTSRRVRKRREVAGSPVDAVSVSSASWVSRQTCDIGGNEVFDDAPYTCCVTTHRRCTLKPVFCKSLVRLAILFSITVAASYARTGAALPRSVLLIDQENQSRVWNFDMSNALRSILTADPGPQSPCMPTTLISLVFRVQPMKNPSARS